jgi:hypothetical protein
MQVGAHVAYNAAAMRYGAGAAEKSSGWLNGGLQFKQAVFRRHVPDVASASGFSEKKPARQSGLESIFLEGNRGDRRYYVAL